MARNAIGILAVAVAALGLSACDGAFPGRAGSDDGPHAPRSVAVMSKSFTVAGPRGFCIDNGATRDNADGAFVLLGSCAVISGNPNDAKPRQPALLTASVAPAGAPLDDVALDQLASYLSTADGRAALARPGSAGPATVLDLSRDGGLLLVHARDNAADGSVADDYWRAIFETAGRVVTITVSGFAEAPLDPRQGARLARSFAAAIRNENPDPAGDGPGNRPTGIGRGLASLFNRLL